MHPYSCGRKVCSSSQHKVKSVGEIPKDRSVPQVEGVANPQQDGYLRKERRRTARNLPNNPQQATHGPVSA